MMEIKLNDVGRRFNVNWIFRNISTVLSNEQHTAILGSNGSGKSTLLRIISGAMSPSEGAINYTLDGKDVPVDQVFRYLSICAPYLDLPLELTLGELLAFHQKIKPIAGVDSPEQFAEKLQLTYFHDKALQLYSSGMQQRVKLGLALLGNSKLVLLDEPTSNLDQSGKDWYSKLVNENRNNRLIVVCSNKQEEEYDFCSTIIDVTDYKTQF